MSALGPFKVGDSPAFPISIDLESRDDLSAYTHVKARLLGPGGGLVADLGQASIVGPDFVASFTLPSDPFTMRGLYTISARLVNAGTRSKSLDPISVLVEKDDGWHTVASARDEWQAAPKDNGTLFRLLEMSREQVEAAADRPTPTVIPIGWREAQKLQARNVYNAAVTAPANSGGLAGAEAPRFKPHPMDWWILQLINPRRGGFGAIA